MRSIENARPAWVSVADHAATSVGLEPVGRAEDRDALALDRRAVRPVRLGRRRARCPVTGSFESPIAANVSCDPDRAVVERVVVGHVHDVDAGGLERGERRRRRTEVEVLPGDRFTAVGDRGLDVDHREVGLRRAPARPDRARAAGRRAPVRASGGASGGGPSSVSQTSGKFTSPANAKVTAFPLPSCAARCDRGDRCGGRRRVSGAGGAGRDGASGIVGAVVVARAQDERNCDDQHGRERREHVAPHWGTLASEEALSDGARDTLAMTSIDELLVGGAGRSSMRTVQLRNESESPVRLGRGHRPGQHPGGGRPRRGLGAARGGQALRGARFDAGLGWIDGPVEYGGRGLTLEHATAFRELEADYELPNLSMLTIAIGFIGPALLAHASPGGARGVPAEALPRRCRDVPALQRAERRLRPRRGGDARGARRRRVGRERAEGVDVERARRRRRARGVPDRSRRSPSTRDSRRSWSTCTRPASRCARCAR